MEIESNFDSEKDEIEKDDKKITKKTKMMTANEINVAMWLYNNNKRISGNQFKNGKGQTSE